MIEMRREKRWPSSIELEVSSLFNQDNVKIEALKEPIEVINVSKAGIGIRSAERLPLNYYFNARLVFSEKECLNCVVKLIREQPKDGLYEYGCEIVGTASIMDYVINDYAATLIKEDDLV